MIVELCGIPGAGKSHLAQALEAELLRAGHAASRPLEPVSPRQGAPARIGRKVALAALEGVTHPAASAGLVRALARSGQGSVREVGVRALNLLVLRASLRRARTAPGTHILDQGLIQELGSLAYRGDGESAMAATAPGPARLAPDLILFVAVDPGLADQRLRARPGTESRLELVDDLDRRDALQRQEHLLTTLLDSWVERFGATVPTAVRRVDYGDDGPRPDLAALVALATECRPDRERVA